MLQCKKNFPLPMHSLFSYQYNDFSHARNYLFHFLLSFRDRKTVLKVKTTKTFGISPVSQQVFLSSKFHDFKISG